MPSDDRAIAISATFTAEALKPALAFWAGELGLDYEIRFATYNTLFQQLLDPTGVFASNRGGVNVALLRFEDWAAAGIEGEIVRFGDAVRSAAASFAAPLIVALCPPTPQCERVFRQREKLLRETIANLPSVSLICPEETLALYPVTEIHDLHGEQLAHLPYTPVFFVALATAIARRIHALIFPPFKVAALDCDETLWAGICGEDGPQGIALDPPRRALQQFLAGRRAAGLLLALCSKNNEEDVIETFRAHPEMPLRLEDFVSRRINWESKSLNLTAIAAELGLGLDSFILLDDSSKEVTEVRAAAPEVLALALPERPEEIPAFLDHVWAFDRARVTEEDRRRPELYVQQAERARAAQTAASLEEFLASLQLEVRIAPMEAAQIPRVAQLTRRTNQMNLTLARRTEAEVQALAPSGAECLTVEVRDRFGSYGLTGVMVFRCERPALVVDSFLLSCRALGRGVEHRMLARLGEIAVERGLERVDVPFVAGPRNRPAALFLEALRTPGADGVFRFPAEEAAAVRLRTANAPTAAAPIPAVASRPARKHVDYGRIASELREPEAILERIRAATRRAPVRASLDPPRTALERDLAELWAGLLNVPTVGIHDNFFDLGGHSLLAVQLLSRVRQIHGVDLSLEVVYSGEFTVAELAKAIELKEIEQSSGEYGDLLKELEDLSDEQVRELLAQEQDAK